MFLAAFLCCAMGVGASFVGAAQYLLDLGLQGSCGLQAGREQAHSGVARHCLKACELFPMSPTLVEKVIFLSH